MDEEGGLQALEGAEGPPIQYRVGLDMDEKLNQVLLIYYLTLLLCGITILGLG